MIYCLLENVQDGAIKIGWTDTLVRRADADEKRQRVGVKGRLMQCQVGNSRTLTVVAISEGTNVQERALQLRFRADRIRGEWFHNRGEVAAFVARNAIEPLGIRDVWPVAITLAGFRKERSAIQPRPIRSVPKRHRRAIVAVRTVRDGRWTVAEQHDWRKWMRSRNAEAR